MDEIKKLQEAKKVFAEIYGKAILTDSYFELENHSELSYELRVFQVFVNNIVTRHDNLADKVSPHSRLVGKRGRKANAEKPQPKTAEDVIKLLS